jgi:hypothetical protein
VEVGGDLGVGPATADQRQYLGLPVGEALGYPGRAEFKHSPPGSAAAVVPGTDQAGFVGDDDCLRPVTELKFGEDVRRV